MVHPIPLVVITAVGMLTEVVFRDLFGSPSCVCALVRDSLCIQGNLVDDILQTVRVQCIEGARS